MHATVPCEKLDTQPSQSGAPTPYPLTRIPKHLSDSIPRVLGNILPKRQSFLASPITLDAPFYPMSTSTCSCGNAAPPVDFGFPIPAITNFGDFGNLSCGPLPVSFSQTPPGGRRFVANKRQSGIRQPYDSLVEALFAAAFAVDLANCQLLIANCCLSKI